jgi:hypothetical protein
MGRKRKLVEEKEQKNKIGKKKKEKRRYFNSVSVQEIKFPKL